MPDSAKKTWKDVVGSAPTGTIAVVRDGGMTRGNVTGVRVDERFGCMLVEYTDPTVPLRSSWLKVETITNAIEIPLSVEFSEEGLGHDEHRFVANHGGVVVTIYVTKRLPIT